MEPTMKPTLVEYRRNSSDMDFSSSESESEKTDGKITQITIDGNMLKNDVSDISNTKKPCSLPKVERSTSIDRSDESAGDDKISRKDDDRKRRYPSPDHRARRNRNREKSSSPEDHRRNHKRRHHSRDRRRDDTETKRNRSKSPDRRRPSRSDQRSRGSPTHHHRHRSRSSDRHTFSPDRHRKRSYRNSRSPELFRSKRLERKVARIDKLGLSLVAEAKDGLGTFAAMANQAKEVESTTGIAFPNYYNPGVMNPSKYAQQIQKRRLLWGTKKETPSDQVPEQASTTGTVKAWEAATFKGDNDGRMTEKFKRLMGMKGDAATVTSPTASTGDSLIQKQEEMFSNMEAQYQVARMATHTHRGIGLGFGTFQVPPR